jgi:hypothetical protein
LDIRTHILVFFLLLTGATVAQQRTIGLLEHSPQTCEGYTLFAPLRSNTTYLIDNEGRLLHSWWSSGWPGMSAYILENGLLARAQYLAHPVLWGGGTGGRISLQSWDGNVVWMYDYVSDEHVQHHDFEVLPNGNILILAWERKSIEEAHAAGRSPNITPCNGLWPTHIMEISPNLYYGGKIVWEWHLWDHLIQDHDASWGNFGDVAAHPERVDINYAGPGNDTRTPDFVHCNGIDYHAGLDQIILSVRHYSELWVIDHSTTTEEAASGTGGRCGKGGDILYRWGNPAAYRRGGQLQRTLYWQHDVHWIPDGMPGAGNILIFNNGLLRPGGEYSSVVEIIPPVDSLGYYFLEDDQPYGPPTPVWEYTAPQPADFFARSLSSAQRLVNGNTLMCDGPYGSLLEVDAQGNVVWKYVNPVTQDGPLRQGSTIDGTPTLRDNQLFRCLRYSPDYPAFDGRTMTPGDPIEQYPALGIGTSPAAPTPAPALTTNFPQPFSDATTLVYTVPTASYLRLSVFNTLGQEVAVLVDDRRAAGRHIVEWRPADLPSGLYLARLESCGSVSTRRLVLLDP